MSEFKADAYKIAPAETGVRRIQSEAITGKLRFTDPNAPSGINLDQIAGIAIDDVYIVAPGGVGASYSTIQSAMTAVRSSSSTKHLILVFPGSYVEFGTVLLDKNDLSIISLGKVVVSNANSVPVFTIQNGTESPEHVEIQGLSIESSAAGVAGVKITGGLNSTVGLKKIELVNCDWTTTGTAQAINAEQVCHIVVSGGSTKNCAGTGNKIVINTCSSFSVDGLADGCETSLTYTDAGDEPSDSSSPVYQLKNSAVVKLTTTLTNKGVAYVDSCTGNFDLVCNGNRTHYVKDTIVTDISVLDTSTLYFQGGLYHSLTAAVGAVGVFSDVIGSDTLSAGSTTKVVTLPYKQLDTNYFVSAYLVETPIVAWGVTNKTTTTFTIEFSASYTSDRAFEWSVCRPMVI